MLIIYYIANGGTPWCGGGGDARRCQQVQQAIGKLKAKHEKQSVRTLLKGLHNFGAPSTFMKLVLLISMCPELQSIGAIDSLELFAGKAAYTNAIAEDGRSSIYNELYLVDFALLF